MKRYWKLISLFLFTIVVWAGFFIQSTLAVSNYPEFIINNEDDQDELGSQMVISGDYRDSKDRLEHLSISNKGSDYLGDKSFLSQVNESFSSFEINQLIKDNRNFMRGKRLESEFFYQDDASIVYANVDSDMSFRGYESVDPSFEVDILNKKSGDRTSFSLNLSLKKKLDYSNISYVHLDENKLQVVGSLSYLDGERGVQEEELHIFTIDVDKKELIADEVILSMEENMSESQDEWTMIDVISDSVGGENAKYVVFMEAIQEVETLPSGEEKYNFKEVEFIAYNLKTGEQKMFELPDDIQLDDTSEIYELKGEDLYLNKIEENKLKIMGYNLSEQAKVSEKTYAIPWESTEDNTFYSVKEDEVVIANRYKSNESDATIVMYDLKSGEMIYEGRVDVKDNKLQSNEELTIYEVNFH